MKKWHVLYRDEKGRHGWLETTDSNTWKIGSLKTINKKLCEIIAVHEVLQ